MDEERICVGCARYGAPVCPDCAALATGVARLRITPLPLLLGGPACLVVLGLGALFFLDPNPNAYSAWRGLGLVGAIAGALGWLVTELRRPRRLRLDDRGLAVVWFPWFRRGYPVTVLGTRRGEIRRGDRTLARVTEDRYPGATAFHRALRVRIRLETESTRTPAAKPR